MFIELNKILGSFYWVFNKQFHIKLSVLMTGLELILKVIPRKNRQSFIANQPNQGIPNIFTINSLRSRPDGATVHKLCRGEDLLSVFLT
jgi:hypothetical protein